MQNQETQKPNVVSLFAAREKAAAKSDGEQPAADDAAPKAESFQDVMDRNQKNADRVAKERANANKSVLRSYRIKN